MKWPLGLLKLGKKQKQWLWFAALWCGGIVAAFLLAALARWMMRLAGLINGSNL
jgi:hypothetical protein